MPSEVKKGRRNINRVRRNDADIAEDKNVEKTTPKSKSKKKIKPFKEGADNFIRSTISIPNDFGRFLYEEVQNGGLKKKMLTAIIMDLLEERYGKEYKEWMEER